MAEHAHTTPDRRTPSATAAPGRRSLFAGAAALALGTVSGDASATTDAAPSVAEMGGMDFEPLSKDLLAEVPSNEEWTDEALKNLVWLRIAVGTMTQTKAHLVAGFENEPEMMTEVAEGIASVIKRLDGICNVLRCAETRLLVAGSSFATGAGA